MRCTPKTIRRFETRYNWTQLNKKNFTSLSSKFDTLNEFWALSISSFCLICWYFFVICVVLVNLSSVLYGYMVGWASSNILILSSDAETPLVDGAIDQEQGSWIASLFAISGVSGTIIFYLIADIIGRKLPLWSIALPHGVSIVSTQIKHLLIINNNIFWFWIIDFNYRLLSPTKNILLIIPFCDIFR